MRQQLLTCAALVLASSGPAAAQQGWRPPAATSDRPVTIIIEPGSGVASSPLLRQLISLDLDDAPFGEALEAVSRQLGGRLMYDEAASALGRRVTLRETDIRAGEALRRILAGTDLELFVPDGGSVVLLKHVAPEPVAEDSVTVRGRVVDATTLDPVAQVVAVVDNGVQRAVTNGNGSFSLPRVPVGERVLTFHRIGYRTTSVTLSLVADRDTSIVVRLTEAPVSLSEVVTTISGNRMRYEVGNSVPVIDAAEEVQNNAFRSLSDLIAGRSIGIITTPSGGSPNAQSRHRIRGINSINASNDPIVIIDGIRAVDGFERCLDANFVDRCDQLPSRLDDFNLHDIESIEILKGPSAAAMWGSEASNGVIVIRTKRGRPGQTRWSAWYEEGITEAPTDFRVPVQGLGRPANGTAVTPCDLDRQATGRCVPIDSVAGGFNRYAHPRTTSMATGRTSDYGLSVSGGNEAIRFYFAGGYRSELGTAKMPEIDQKLVREALDRPLPEWMVRPDAKATASFTGRINGQFNERLRYTLATRFIQLDSRTGSDGVFGAGADLRTVADTFELSNGWEKFYVERKHRTTRFVGSLALDWHPTSWFSGRAVFGRDYAFNDGGEFARRNWCLPFCESDSNEASGKVAYGEGRRMAQTVDLGGTLQVPILNGRVVLETSFGAQHTRTKSHRIHGTAFDLPVGRTDFNAAPNENRRVYRTSDDRATFGTYVQQTVGLNERLFVSAALRRDIGSALGAEVAPLYPKLSVSWLASEEPFLPLRDRGISLRLRGAFGHAGVQPSTTAKYRTFSQLPRFVLPDGSLGTNYARISGVGNAELRPERSVESEGGFELGLFDDRLVLDFTYFHKFTRDAIVSRELAPSLGLGSVSTQYYNVGDVRNSGMEAFLTAHIIEHPLVSWTMQIAYASRENELVSLGPGVEPFTLSSIDLATAMDYDAVVMPGYPLFGRWARAILGYSDANGDGIITAGEVKLADSLVFVGPSQPEADVSVRPELDLWNGRVRLGAALSYVHGLTQFNQYAASTRFTSPETYDPDTPLGVQACYAAARPPLNNEFCFYETVNVLRLRSASIGFMIPDRLLRMVGAQAGTLHVMGTNLGVWSEYDGLDPMVNTQAASGNRLIGGAVVPQGRTWTLRTQLTF